MKLRGPSWKPDHCADCGVVHPSLSLNGWRGPWRCQECHADALVARDARKVAA
ncbi:hypothetical protein [Novosphingobium humi]|uniref:hypothetical protein n=1 Tax=Novosphingobium humi TaxID=2282397 RepID=UPI0025B2268B|nr:hypothetical protein [Novosphingobium humi]WJS97818.1 hypothetical protein NYQ05_11810 [Novosphingobium humi]